MIFNLSQPPKQAVATSYNITNVDSSNVTIQSTAFEGETVPLTCTSGRYYITVTYKLGGSQTLATFDAEYGTSFSFIMPADDVTVSTFAKPR